MRHAPAGQTLSDIQEKQQQAAELASQQTTEQTSDASQTENTPSQAVDKDYVPFTPAA